MRVIKFSLFILILALEIFPIPAMADLTQGLVACYPFDGSASDISGNGNHGTVHGAVLVEDRLGKASSAYQFNGVDNYIEVSDSDSLDIQKDITITGWVKVNAYTSSPWLGIINKADDDSNDTFEVVINNGGRYLHFPLMFEGSGRLTYNSSNNLFGVGEWHFFGVTYNGTNVYIYIDGVLNKSYVAPNQNLNQNSHNLIIGAEREAVNGPHYLNGILDEIRIYNRSLSEKEIVSLYENNEKCTVSSLVELTHFVAIPKLRTGITLTWQTISEPDSIGFEIWRANKPNDGECLESSNYRNVRRLTSQLIATQGDLNKGASYFFEDKEVKSGESYCYLLVDFNSKGQGTAYWNLVTSAVTK